MKLLQKTEGGVKKPCKSIMDADPAIRDIQIRPREIQGFSTSPSKAPEGTYYPKGVGKYSFNSRGKHSLEATSLHPMCEMGV
jgi:hypothetical protein